MNKRPVLCMIVFLVLLSVSAFAQDYHVRIGFLGNSITAGSGLANPTRDSYPSQLGVLLQGIYGDTCVISNYAVSGRTMLKHGDFPIWNEPEFSRCWNYAPDICFISLGTNDSKPYNWDDYKQEFYEDYMSMIDTFKVRNPDTKFIVCLPPPAFGVVFDIRNPVIIDEIIPLLDSIVKTTGAEVIDFYHPLLDSLVLFPDKIHPNPTGAAAMAKIAFNQILNTDIIHKVGRGHAFVTRLSSNVTAELRVKDPATLSWTSVNGTEAFLNGEPVDLNGSAIVTPLENTEYILKVKGALDSDSLTLLQKVYFPTLTKMGASPSALTIYPGDTSKIKLRYYDQKNKLITDSVFNVSYAVVEGYGQMVNQGDNYIEFVADSVGKAKVECTSGGVIYTISLTIKEFPASVELIQTGNGILLYPNPFDKVVKIKLPVSKPVKVEILLFNSAGRLCLRETRHLTGSGIHDLDLNTSKLSNGIYLYNVEISGKSLSGRIIKE